MLSYVEVLFSIFAQYAISLEVHFASSPSEVRWKYIHLAKCKTRTEFGICVRQLFVVRNEAFKTL